MVEHGFAHDIFLGADEAGIGNGNGFAFVKQISSGRHVLFDFGLGEAVDGRARMGRKGDDGIGPGFVDAVEADGIAEVGEIGSGKLGEVEGRLLEESGRSGDGGFDERGGVIRNRNWGSERCES